MSWRDTHIICIRFWSYTFFHRLTNILALFSLWNAIVVNVRMTEFTQYFRYCYAIGVTMCSLWKAIKGTRFQSAGTNYATTRLPRHISYFLPSLPAVFDSSRINIMPLCWNWCQQAETWLMHLMTLHIRNIMVWIIWCYLRHWWIHFSLTTRICGGL